MKHLLVIILLAWAGIAQGTIKVVTTLPDLADLTRQVGGDRVTVDNIVRGDQNPHFVEVKPSYMMKLKSADLFFMIGMDLEMWAPQIIDGSRNTKLEVVDLSKRIDKLEIPAKLDASEGDVHRYGNPHYWLDPRNIRVMVEDIVAALARVSPADETVLPCECRCLSEEARREDRAVVSDDEAVRRQQDRHVPQELDVLCSLARVDGGGSGGAEARHRAESRDTPPN